MLHGYHENLFHLFNIYDEYMVVRTLRVFNTNHLNIDFSEIIILIYY